MVIDSETSSPYKSLENVDVSKYRYFTQFPLSPKTLKGLKMSGFTKPTDIQKLVIKHALLGKDVVAEAPTGSGKTLAFLVPLLEILHINHVSSLDGPVAIVLTPTRELSRQIFKVLNKVCREYRFTIMDIMGGKSCTLKKLEWNSIARANILIGTPGRLAQHQTENPLLDTSNLRILILDEADRLLDTTFRGDLETIVQNLTPDRQTLLFSATQTKTTDQLVRLSMQDPVIVSIKSSSNSHTPIELIQTYAVVPLEQKLDTLWTFLQSHCKKKIIVFFSTQKQVRFVFELFQQLRPYFRVLQIRGNMNQNKRFQVYDRFMNTPQGAVLLATNLAERGLDFPGVDWVVQADCPHLIDDYIHRVGRTARHGHLGRSILFLLPSEIKLIELLSKRSIILRPQKFPESKIIHIVTKRAPELLVHKLELAKAARLAFMAYLRDYCLIARSNMRTHCKLSSSSSVMNTSDIFDPKLLPIESFANSLGLPCIPDLPKEFLNLVPNAIKLVKSFPDLTNCAKTMLTDTNANDLLNRKISDEQIESHSQIKRLDLIVDSTSSSSSDDDDELVKKKEENLLELKSIHDSCTEISSTNKTSSKKKKSLSRIQQAKKELKRKVRNHTKILFGDDGKIICKKIGDVPIPQLNINDSEITHMNEPIPISLDIEKERKRLHDVVDKEDKKLWRELVKKRHQMKRKKLKDARIKIQQATQPKCVLGEGSDEEDDEEKEEEEEQSEENDQEPDDST